MDYPQYLHLEAYVSAVRSALSKALAIQPFPCQEVERHNKPEVEFGTSPELVLEPVIVARNDSERCLIEASINSVRVSLKVKQADELEEILARWMLRFLTQRAEDFLVLRRAPVGGYDISFLVTSQHLEAMRARKLVDFVATFLEEADAGVSELKLSVSSRGRLVAAEYLRRLA